MLLRFQWRRNGQHHNNITKLRQIRHLFSTHLREGGYEILTVRQVLARMPLKRPQKETMSIEVPDAVKLETNRCTRYFACLSTGGSSDQAKCKIDYSDGKNVLFIASYDEQFSCKYRIHFGYSQICTCPVHYYLYNIEPYRAGNSYNTLACHGKLLP